MSKQNLPGITLEDPAIRTRDDIGRFLNSYPQQFLLQNPDFRDWGVDKIREKLGEAFDAYNRYTRAVFHRDLDLSQDFSSLMYLLREAKKRHALIGGAEPSIKDLLFE